MIMNVKKRLWSIAHMALPIVGLALTCLGAYLMSLQGKSGDTWSAIPAYIMILSGFLIVLIGIFWTICRSARSKMYQRGRHEQHVQVYTVERPSSFPPSYEESQGSQLCPHTAPEFVVVVDGVDVVMSLAPPLYSQDSSEAPDCMWSWEQPPQYSQVVHLPQQSEVHADETREASCGR